MPFICQRFIASLIVLLALLVAQSKVHAIRPFVTDDARVVGDRLGQVESWLVLDRQETAHNTLFAIGPTNWLEITSGFTHGGSYRYTANTSNGNNYGITGGILQAKALLRETKPNNWPGVAFAAGVVPPFGSGSPKPDGVSTFGYAAISQSFFNDDLLFHINLGVTSIKEETQWKPTWTAGFGYQAKIIGKLNSVAEIYRGDPYDPTMKSIASQIGFRYIFNFNFQMDATFGSTLEKDSSQWITVGVRIVSPELW
jgi:hypothetical protein